MRYALMVGMTLVLVGCASETWTAGPNVNPNLTLAQQRAQCTSMTGHNGGVGEAGPSDMDFNTCMRADGCAQIESAGPPGIRGCGCRRVSDAVPPLLVRDLGKDRSKAGQSQPSKPSCLSPVGQPGDWRATGRGNPGETADRAVIARTT